MKWALGLSGGVMILLAGCASLHTAKQDASPYNQGIIFAKFYNDLEKEVQARGLDLEVLNASYAGATPAPIEALVAAETTQAEFAGNLATYQQRAVSAARGARGRMMLKEHRATLAKTAQKYGVPAELIVALWGMESDYGRQQGNKPLIPTLVSLAYQSPRHAMFKRELFVALTLPNAALIKGSWAGASGHCQFMPSNIVKYAIDGNDDGKVDIWATEADAFASTANFLLHLGYKPGQPWRWRVNNTPDLKGIVVNERGLSEPLPLSQWRMRGVTVAAGLPSNTALRYYRPEANGPANMVGPNYEAVLGWNYSSFFATSVFMLAEQIGE